MTALKAYSVQDDENGVVVFAPNNATARREGGDELGGGWESIETCRRAPEFDEFTPGPVPAKALLEAGWWQECAGCGQMVREGDGGYDEEGDDDGEYVERVPVFRGKSVYCCARCMAVDDAELRLRSHRDAALIELVLLKYPETILVDHVYAGHKLFERGRDPDGFPI